MCGHGLRVNFELGEVLFEVFRAVVGGEFSDRLAFCAVAIADYAEEAVVEKDEAVVVLADLYLVRTEVHAWEHAAGDLHGLSTQEGVQVGLVGGGWEVICVVFGEKANLGTVDT